jgi:hypothetical protein
VLDGILLEKAGVPAVSIVTTPFISTGREMASDWGVPEYRFLDIPHPIANLSEAELDQRADSVIDAVVELLKTGQPREADGAERPLAVPAG